jgi:hypothetical protein
MMAGQIWEEKAVLREGANTQEQSEAVVENVQWYIRQQLEGLVAALAGVRLTKKQIHHLTILACRCGREVVQIWEPLQFLALHGTGESPLEVMVVFYQRLTGREVPGDQVEAAPQAESVYDSEPVVQRVEEEIRRGLHEVLDMLIASEDRISIQQLASVTTLAHLAGEMICALWGQSQVAAWADGADIRAILRGFKSQITPQSPPEDVS